MKLRGKLRLDSKCLKKYVQIIGAFFTSKNNSNYNWLTSIKKNAKVFLWKYRKEFYKR